MTSQLNIVGAALNNNNVIGLCPWFESVHRIQRVWIHVGWGFFNAPNINTTVGTLSDLAVTDVVIDMNRPNNTGGHGFDGGWHPNGTVEQALDRLVALQAAQNRNISPTIQAPQFDAHLLFHISPRRNLLEGLNTFLVELIEGLPADHILRSVVLDAEQQQNWWDFNGPGLMNSQSFTDLFDAYQERGFLEEAEGVGIPIGATDYAMMRRAVAPAFGTLLAYCTFVMPQAYYGRYWIRDTPESRHDPAYLQKDHSHPAFAPHTDQNGVQLGVVLQDGSAMPQVPWLSAFDGVNSQVQFNRSWRGTMERELSAIDVLTNPPEIDEVAYWTYRGVAGASERNSQRQEFIRCLSLRARQRHGFTSRLPLGG